MRELKKQKSFYLTHTAVRLLAEMKEKTGRSEADLVDEMIRKADALIKPVDREPVLKLLQSIEGKVDELLDKAV